MCREERKKWGKKRRRRERKGRMSDEEGDSRDTERR